MDLFKKRTTDGRRYYQFRRSPDSREFYVLCITKGGADPYDKYEHVTFDTEVLREFFHEWEREGLD